jgi:hypothetical protein
MPVRTVRCPGIASPIPARDLNDATNIKLSYYKTHCDVRNTSLCMLGFTEAIVLAFRATRR